MTCESDLKFKLQFPQMKFCWNTITPVCFYMICGCLPTTTAELGCDGDRMAYKAQNIYCLALCRKSVPTPGPEPEERDRAWWAGQKAKGSRFHSTSTTSSHLNLMAAPWDRWDGRKLRNREVMPFPQGLIAGYWETNSHLSFSLWQVCPQCHIAPQLSDQSLYSCPRYFFSPCYVAEAQALERHSSWHRPWNRKAGDQPSSVLSAMEETVRASWNWAPKRPNLV